MSDPAAEFERDLFLAKYSKEQVIEMLQMVSESSPDEVVDRFVAKGYERGDVFAIVNYVISVMVPQLRHIGHGSAARAINRERRIMLNTEDMKRLIQGGWLSTATVSYIARALCPYKDEGQEQMRWMKGFDRTYAQYLMQFSDIDTDAFDDPLYLDGWSTCERCLTEE